jgi:hypothetical protein
MDFCPVARVVGSSPAGCYYSAPLKALRFRHPEVEAFPLEANGLGVHLVDAFEDALLEFVE